MGRFSVLQPYLPILVLWVSMAAMASLLFRELGFARIRKYPLTVLVLLLCLVSVPAAGLVKLARPYQRRIQAMVFRETSPDIGGKCAMFPPDNIWNRRIDDLPADANTAAYVESIGGDLPLHPDFGPAAGIPYAVSDGRDAPARLTIGAGAPESERGPYRIPENTPIEPATDAHALVVNTEQCVLYELFSSRHVAPQEWQASSAAIFDLRSNQLRPDGWTSADAAGLPILPGLARYEEVAAGRIAHALRFTVQHTRRAYVWPARHYASSSTDPRLPAMGQRFRLRASFDLSGFSPDARVILTAIKEYGIILADNGGDWYISGAPDSRWRRGLAAEFRKVHGSDLEAVDTARLMISPDSGQARP